LLRHAHLPFKLPSRMFGACRHLFLRNNKSRQTRGAIGLTLRASAFSTHPIIPSIPSPLLQVKVVGALGRAGVRGPPRDIRAVVRDRLRSILRLLAASLRPASSAASSSASPPRVGGGGHAGLGSQGGGASAAAAAGGGGLSLAHRIRALTAFNRKLVVPETAVGSAYSATATAVDGDGADGDGSGGGEELVVNWKALRTNREYALQAFPVPLADTQ
jgi:hypothetical protein